MLLKISNFRGLAPRFHPEQLADGLAVKADNIYFGEALRGWRLPTDTTKNVPAITEYLFQYKDEYWFSWPNRTHAVEAPLLNDPWGYAVITDEQHPKITRSDIAIGGSVYPNASYRLGVAIPGAVTASDQPNALYTGPEEGQPEYDETQVDPFTTTYKVTFVNKWGQEGAGSQSSNPVDLIEYLGEMVQEVTINLPAAPVGNPLMGAGAMYRIYRMNASSQGSGVYQFVAEVPIEDTQYIDRIPSSDLAEAIFTDSWIGPPDDNAALFPNGPLQHICVVGEAFLCGHNKKMVCFSEPRTTHAWPAEYYHLFQEKVIRTVTYGGDVIVLTDDTPYSIQGVHPSSMSRVRLAEPAPCINPDAVCVVAGSVFYAGDRGLYAISGTSVQLVSDALYDVSQWQALNPKTMRFSRHQNLLHIHLDSGVTLVLDPVNPTNGISTLSLDFQATHTDPETGNLHYSDSSGDVYKHDSAADRDSISYESKHYRFFDAIAFNYGRVRANKYPVDVTIHARRLSGTKWSYTKTVTNDRFFQLPVRSQMIEWWIEVNGDVDIRAVGLSTSLQELTNDL